MKTFKIILTTVVLTAIAISLTINDIDKFQTKAAGTSFFGSGRDITTTSKTVNGCKWIIFQSTSGAITSQHDRNCPNTHRHQY